MKIPSPTFLIKSFSDVIRRFPLAMLSALVGAIAAMYLIEESADPEDIFPKLLMTGAIGLPLFLSANLIAEKWRLKSWKKWLPSLIAVLLLLTYFFSLEFPDGDNHIPTMMRFTGINLAAHLLVAFVPFLDTSPPEDFWEYNKRLIGNFLVGAFYSAVIFAGLSIAIAAVDNLFELNIDSRIYGHLFVVVAALFNTSFFLKLFPEEFAYPEISETSYTTAIKTLTKFILIPIVAVYFLILYAYSAKILMTWELPKGWVSSLVIGFSVAGIFTYLLNYLLPKFDNSFHLEKFRKWFFYVLFPMVILLFLGIGRRIDDYGITEERFIVAAIGVWLLLLSLYFIISKKDNIKIIPISLAIFALLSVLGPLNAFIVSSKNQASRLMELLEKNNMLQDGKAKAAPESITKEDSESIRSIIHYMREFSHFEQIQTLFPDAFNTKFPDWTQVDSLLASLNLSSQSAPKGQCSFNFTASEYVDIVGYNQLYQIDKTATPTNNQEDKKGWHLSDETNSLEFWEDGAAVETLSFSAYLDEMALKYKCFDKDLPQTEGLIDRPGNQIEMRMVLRNLTFESGEKKKIVNLNGILMTRNK